MTAPRDGEVRGATGASRRDVLRGSAIGVGAFVGALGLINANEVSSEARAGTGLKLTVGFAGNGMSVNRPVPLQSYELGGQVDSGPTPTQTTLTLDTSKYSPKLLQVYAEAMTLTKIVILAYEPNVQGLETLVLTITLTNARITSFHTDAASSRIRDSLVSTWSSLTILRNDVNRTYTWQLPA